jgi:hypothetical protein
MISPNKHHRTSSGLHFLVLFLRSDSEKGEKILDYKEFKIGLSYVLFINEYRRSSRLR